MTRGEKEVLNDIAVGVGGGGWLPKAWFDTYPPKRKIAKNLMWLGFIEACGPLANDVRLTPAGRFILAKTEGQGT